MSYNMEFDKKRLSDRNLIHLYLEYTEVDKIKDKEKEGHNFNDGYIDRTISKEEFLKIIEMLDINETLKEEE